MFSQNLLYRYAHFRINLNNQNVTHNDVYNCICSNKLYINKQSRIEHEKICNDDVISDLIIEEDWLKMLTFYENAYIKDLKPNYKKEFDKIKHLRNKDFLILLNKISNESKIFKKYLNNKTVEYPSVYWSKLLLKDFQINN